jgi:glycerophosphoryl diester phosphodiesterase
VHENGLKIAVWTVDNPSDMIKFANMKVDCIVTNNPELAVKTLKQK